MPARRILFWAVLASLGIGLAAGVTVATSQLAQQPIGLSSEPLTAGDALTPQPARAAKAPRARPAPARHHRKHHSVHRVVPPPPVAPALPVVVRAAPAPIVRSAPTKVVTSSQQPAPRGEHDDGATHDDHGDSSSSSSDD